MLTSSSSGSGGILAGTSLGKDGVKGEGTVKVLEQQAPEPPKNVVDQGSSSKQAASTIENATEQALRDALQKREEQSFQSADVVTGTWSGGAFTTGGSSPNAVRVTGRRTAARNTCSKA